MDSREIPQAGARPSCRRDNDLDAPGEPSTYRRSHYDAGDLVPGNHSGLASLPGADQATVGYVDPPVFTASASPPAEGGTLYDYAISNQFQPTGGESTASVVEVAMPAGATVNLKWDAVCHAADYRIYREVVGTGQRWLGRVNGTFRALTRRRQRTPPPRRSRTTRRPTQYPRPTYLVAASDN